MNIKTKITILQVANKFFFQHYIILFLFPFFTINCKTIVSNSIIKTDEKVQEEVKLVLEFINAKDSVLWFNLINKSNDTVLYSINYNIIYVKFNEHSIYQATKVLSKMLYPDMEFSSEEYRQKNYLNFCRSFIDSSEFTLLAPNEYLEINYDLGAYTFRNFKDGKNYEGKITIYVSDQIKSYCPHIWTGVLETNFNYTQLISED